MAQRIEFRERLNFPVDVVLRKIIDPPFMTEWAVVQKAIGPKVTVLEQTDARAVIRIDLEEPLPPPAGKTKAQMIFTWDLGKRACQWQRQAEGMAGKARVYGKTELIPEGENACTLYDEIFVDVGIPLIGKKMEQLVLDDLKSGRTKKMLFLSDRLAKDAG